MGYRKNNDRTTQAGSPSAKRLVLEISAMALLFIVICIVTRLAMKRTYTAYIPLPGGEAAQDAGPGGAAAWEDAAHSIRLDDEEEEIISIGEPVIQDGYMRIEVRPGKAGVADAEVFDREGDPIASQGFRVSRFGTIYDENTGGFTGDTVVLGCFAAFCLYIAIRMILLFFASRGPALYSYHTVYTAGFSVFALNTGILMLYLTMQRLLAPSEFLMLNAYQTISSASFSFMKATLPFVVVFAVLMIISNIELLRHERRRLANLLGILIGISLLAGELIAFLLYARDFMGSVTQLRIHETVQNVYATVFAYLECMLFGAVICAVRAVLHRPELDKDYIIILGCGFRKDGTLTPLLRGRVDRAVSFWKEQREKTGKTAVLIPSGGQGPGEVMEEAEAMRRYLTADLHIPEKYVIPEKQSRNTYQNMAYSKKIIEGQAGGTGAKTVYATTNYHVFRSGVWAGLAGLEAEGIGSRTKWWFWPNAFVRECVGLLQKRLPQEILLLALLTGFFAMLSMVLVG